MPEPTFDRRGGMRRKSLGDFIQLSLSDGAITWEQELYKDYKAYLKSKPLAGETLTTRKGKIRPSKRRVMSYEGFRNYIRMFKVLGLIEEVTDETGAVVTEIAKTRDGKELPQLQPRRFIRMVSGADGSPDWKDPIGALGYRG